MKNCRETRRLLERAFEGRVALEEDFRIEEHVRECAACRLLYGRSRALQDALLDLPAPPQERLDIERSLRAVRRGIDALEAPGLEAPTGARYAVRMAQLAIGAGILIALVWGVALLVGDGASGSEGSTLEVASERVAIPRAPEPALQAVRDSAPDLPAADLPAAGPFVATGVDEQRLADARAAVRAVLIEAAPLLPADADKPECAAFVQHCDVALQPWVARGWPVQNIVAGLTRSDDASLARAGLRYLGLRGGRTAARALVDGLGREDCKRAAALALIDCGDGRGLVRAVWDCDLQALVSARLLPAKRPLSEEQFDWWLEAIDAAPRGSEQVQTLAAGLLPALIAGDERGAREMIARAVDGPFLEADLLDALERTSGASQAVVDAVASLGSLDDDAFLLLAVERLQPPEALPWLASLADDRRKRARALEVIAGFEDTRALQRLLDLVQDDEDSLRAWRRAVDGADTQRLLSLANELVAFGRLADARRMLELCIRSERAAAVPPVLVLVRSRLFSVEERALALLAVGNSVGEQHVKSLRLLFAALGPDERKLAAATLVTLHAVGGPEASLDLIGAGTESRKKRVKTLLDRAAEDRGTALALFKLAYELEGVLGTARPESWRNAQ